MEYRFWKKVNVLANTIKCWEWKASTHKNGYGKFRVSTKIELSHRVAYELFYGPFDKSLSVLHKCDNRKCVNPYHLFLGTQLDNLRDMGKKGRAHLSGKYGKHHPFSKFTYATNLESGIELQFVSRTHAAQFLQIDIEKISEIIKGKRKQKRGWIFYE